MEKLSSPSTFLGALGASSFGGGSSFFLGTAIGPMSPCGPPASAGALALGVGVAVGLAWACPLCACATGMDSHSPAIRESAARKRKQAFPLEIRSGLTACIKSISHCLFMSLYFSIDARTQLFRSHFSRAAGPVRTIVFAALICSMKKVVVLLNVLFVFLSLGHAQTRAASLPSPQDPAPTKIMKVDDVRPGMKGVGYTVFQGTKPEAMGVEVLGVLRNLSGPKSDVVLVKLVGEKPEFTGVVAGMSGSPVYIDGKLLGAIAYRIGQFSKEPI